MRVSLGMYYESALGTLLALQAAAGLGSPLVLPPEHSFFLILAAQVTKQIPEIKDGKLRLPDEPRLETMVDWTAVERLKL